MTKGAEDTNRIWRDSIWIDHNDGIRAVNRSIDDALLKKETRTSGVSVGPDHDHAMNIAKYFAGMGYKVQLTFIDSEGTYFISVDFGFEDNINVRHISI